MIVVIDCGIGNLQSVVRALRSVGADAVASSDAGAVAAAEKIVLPGVGSLAQGMDLLRRHRLLPILERKVRDARTPVLGICLGQQMLTQWSEEGNAAGLGWIAGRTERLRAADPHLRVKVPHLGWNTLRVTRACPLLEGIDAEACFYFAHSYATTCDDDTALAATTQYGREFASVIHQDNIFGTQFHPEKSQANGLRVLRNFVEYA